MQPKPGSLFEVFSLGIYCSERLKWGCAPVQFGRAPPATPNPPCTGTARQGHTAAGGRIFLSAAVRARKASDQAQKAFAACALRACTLVPIQSARGGHLSLHGADVAGARVIAGRVGGARRSRQRGRGFVKAKPNGAELRLDEKTFSSGDQIRFGRRLDPAFSPDANAPPNRKE